MTPAQCRAARALLDLDQRDLALRANVSLNVIREHENGRRTITPRSMAKIEAVLTAAGVFFLNGDNDGFVGVCVDPLRASIFKSALEAARASQAAVEEAAEEVVAPTAIEPQDDAYASSHERDGDATLA